MEADMHKAAFIDRDGVINVERHHVFRVADFELLPGAIAGLRHLAEQGYRLVVVTNQAGLAKGLYTDDDYAVLTRHMQALLAQEGIALAGVYHCPHHPQGSVPRYAKACDCRKPAPGLLLRAAAELGLNLAQSVLVGDKPSDTAAGRAAGLHRTVLVESGHELPPDTHALADHRCADLAAAAAWLGRADQPTKPVSPVPPLHEGVPS
jgi:D-glycero-D-manno-heptose 1,7-bisphosphate phosphatase